MTQAVKSSKNKVTRFKKNKNSSDNVSESSNGSNTDAMVQSVVSFSHSHPFGTGLRAHELTLFFPFLLFRHYLFSSSHGIRSRT